MSWVATAIVGSAAIGAGTQIYTSGKAADAQKGAADQAASQSLKIYNDTLQDLAPYRDIGTKAANQLTDQLPYLTSPIVMDQANLEKTPGYQFNLTQGLKAVQNSAAARGLGNSGAALKGAANFATGLADNTYQQQFANENTNRTNAYSRLKGLLDTGETAAAGGGTIGAATNNTAANATIAGGNAAAAGYNAIGNSVNNFSNNVAGYAAYRGLYGANSTDAINPPGGSNYTPGPYG